MIIPAADFTFDAYQAGEYGDHCIVHGDCREVMPTMDTDSIDSIVTDPPYGLKFMGKDWDKGVPSVHFWQEAIRVAKPGCYLLAFGGTRTFHRLAVAIEDAGWEIRDTIMWVYGSGFPKSLDVSKAIDKAAGVQREVIGQKIRGDVEKAKSSGVTMAAAEANRNNKAIFGYGIEDITIPSTDAARQWDGWGTGLKPAWEPIIVARKPLIGTVAENVQKYGTGALNIDGCRVCVNTDVDDMLREVHRKPRKSQTWEHGSGFKNELNPSSGVHSKGRFPANLIHDGSEEVLDLFPQSTSGAMKKPYEYKNNGFSMGSPTGSTKQIHESSEGSAARFFYCAKASKAERNAGCEDDGQVTSPNYRPNDDGTNGIQSRLHGATIKGGNTHPTVKPIALMRYLCRLVTPPNGVVLDPFMGSGSTLIAAGKEGFRSFGVELEIDATKIAEQRLAQEVLGL